MNPRTEPGRKYDHCPRAPDLEEFHVSIALLEQRSEQHTELLMAHNGYIRQNQGFQNRIIGGLLVASGLSGVAAAFSILARFQ